MTTKDSGVEPWRYLFCKKFDSLAEAKEGLEAALPVMRRYAQVVRQRSLLEGYVVAKDEPESVRLVEPVMGGCAYIEFELQVTLKKVA